MSETKSFASIVVAAILAAALLGSCWILAGALVKVKSDRDMIRVTGSARKPIRSDLIIWRGRIALRAPDLSRAYLDLKTGIDKARAYLVAHSITENEMTVSAIETRTLYAKPPRTPYDQSQDTPDTFRQIEGYELSEDIEVRSTRVDLVGDVSRKSTELISQGVHFESQPPQYVYTKLSDMKVTMLAQAAKDARSRADQIANNSGCRVGSVRFARMGVLQITPIYSTAVSSEGINDTSSLDKDITAIVTMGFSIR